jgi:mannosyltransferase
VTAHNRFVLALAVALLLIAAWARFHHIGAQSLWNDEGNSYGQSLRTLPDIAVNAAADIHPPGYYALLAGWRVLTGESEFALRALSAFASILSAAVAFALGKRLYGDTAGLTALAAVAVNTFSIMYAQEARMYALLALCGAASTWALIDAILKPGRRAAILLALTTAAGLYTNYAYAGVLAFQAVFGLAWLAWALWTKRPVISVVQTAALGYGVALLLYLPWLPTALRQVTQWGSTGQPIPFEEALSITIGWLTVGPTYTTVGVTVGVVVLLAMGLYNLNPLSVDATERGASRGRISRLLTLALPPLWVLVTVGGFFALGLFREANLKFLIPAQIAVALWLGRGAWVLWHLSLHHPARWTHYLPRVLTVLMVVTFVLGARGGIEALHSDPQFQRDDYRGIAQAIAADGQPDAAVILNAPGQIEVFRYYARRYGPDWTLAPLPVGLTVDEAATRAELESLAANHDRIYAVLWGTDERDPQGVVEHFLNSQAYPIDERWFDSVRLARFVTRGPLREAQTAGAEFEFPGGTIELVDYALSSDVLVPGGSLEIALNWRANITPPQNYKVTVQLLSPEGLVVTQRDAEPAGYQRPTSTWQADEIIYDLHALILPNDLVPAHYRLIVGLYDPESPETRLQVEGQDAYMLAEFETRTDQ